jgi:hypothetical protein
MVSKHPKAKKPTSAPKSQPKQPDKLYQKTERLIKRNGELVESLMRSEVWSEIIEPLLQEQIASVCGRKTNGRWHHGSFTRDKNISLEYLKGYQCASMDFHNRIHDFIKFKEDLLKKKNQEDAEKRSPVVNTFLDDLNNEPYDN